MNDECLVRRVIDDNKILYVAATDVGELLRALAGSRFESIDELKEELQVIAAQLESKGANEKDFVL